MHAGTNVDGKVEWREHADPRPGTGELLVRVQSAGLNSADLMQVAGFYPPPAGSPADIPGLELAGDVVAVGDGAHRFRVGDRVMAVVGGGGQAELALVHERTALAVPDALSWPEAGGFPEVFTTAHDALFTQCGLTTGEPLLVHGAAGGVGVAAVQLGALTGARVTATVRNSELRDGVARLGGPVVTVVAPDEFAALAPFDVVLELVGAPNIPHDLDALAIGGRISVIGISGGARAELNLGTLMGKRARIHGSTLRPRPLEEKADAARRVARHVLPAVAHGRVRVPVAATYPMSDARAAYDHFAAGGKLGKIVLVTE